MQGKITQSKKKNIVGSNTYEHVKVQLARRSAGGGGQTQMDTVIYGLNQLRGRWRGKCMLWNLDLVMEKTCVK